MKFPRTDLEHWRVLQAVVEYGGFAQAAERLHRSQSAISYAIARLQEQLGTTLLRPEGRRMVLTEAGTTLLRDATPLVEGLIKLETRATALEQGWEAEVRLAVDRVYPTRMLLCSLAGFAARCTQTRVQVHEVVMSGADDALLEGNVELAVAGRVPQGFLGDWLMDVEFIAVAHPDHPLHRLGRVLTIDDLKPHLQVVIRDSGKRAPRNEGWLGAEQRWTVSGGDTSIAIVSDGLAFAWLPRHSIQADLDDGRLKPLPLQSGQIRRASLYLIFADPASAGPATHQLAECIRQVTAEEAAKASAT